MERVARGLRNGNPADVAAVSQRVQRIVRYRGFGIPRDEREEIEQEALSQIWEAANGANFTAGEGFWSFVDVVAARRCVDWYRKARTKVELDDGLEDTRGTPLSRALDREKVTLVRRAVTQLNAACRELIRLRVEEEMSFDEISQRLNRTPGALRVQFYRCVRSVQRQIGNLYGAEKNSESR
ncbi:MAG TPA: sigma-70 family RNA polymerase sigma factor [Vicinamibacteria bacterium]|nr:sigma-70 family RNA polymerase sigma factor [Vicinamibacteria bacterium]